MIASNLKAVLDKINTACEISSRDPNTVDLMAVTKKVSEEVIGKAYDAGIRLFGENKVQEARPKIETNAFRDAKVGFIGHLQTNKASMAVRLFDAIHSVDSFRLAQALSRFSQMYEKQLEIMIQVNMGREEQKNGVMPEGAKDLVKAVLDLPGLRLTGLMTVAPVGDMDVARFCFRELRALRDGIVDSGVDRVNLKHLSMGMSGDYVVAIEEGATIIRLGSTLFGPRY